MSRVRARFLTDTVTVWRQAGYSAANPYGGQWQLVGSYPCRTGSGGSVTRGDDGSEFVPLTKYYTQTGSIKFGDRVAIGTHTDATPITTAETVRAVRTKTPLVGSQDYTYITG